MQAFENSIFQFCKFLSDEVPMVFQEREWKLSRTLFIGNILENGLKANFRRYSISWAFQNRIFHIVVIFSVTKLKQFLGESEADKSKFLNSKFFIVSILEYGFETTLRSKANVVNLWKCNSFLQIFERKRWSRFLGKWDKAFKNV